MTLDPKRLVGSLLAFVAIAAVIAIGWVWLQNGSYGLNVIARRGGSYWQPMKVSDARLSPAMRQALVTPPPAISSGNVTWRRLVEGYEVGELPVLANGKQVDVVLLNRIDPSRFQFTVRNVPGGDYNIDGWERKLHSSILIVNGSYYGLKGYPDTPVVMSGVRGGPSTYDAHAGAFVAKDGAAEIVDLRDRRWQNAVAPAANAMVSYPLLIGADGETHVFSQSRWLANRTFVGETRQGRIIIGTTREAFFTLDRFAAFLKQSPLDLKMALNLDGGPVACQSVRLGAFHRKFYARWEAQVSGDQVKLLSWPFKNGTWAMPMVLTVEPR